MTGFATEVTRSSTLLACLETLGALSGGHATAEMCAVARALGGSGLPAHERAQHGTTNGARRRASEPSQCGVSEDAPTEPFHRITSAKSSGQNFGKVIKVRIHHSPPNPDQAIAGDN
jgi:hypothetical protein